MFAPRYCSMPGLTSRVVNSYEPTSLSALVRALMRVDFPTLGKPDERDPWSPCFSTAYPWPPPAEDWFSSFSSFSPRASPSAARCVPRWTCCRASRRSPRGGPRSLPPVPLAYSRPLVSLKVFLRLAVASPDLNDPISGRPVHGSERTRPPLLEGSCRLGNLSTRLYRLTATGDTTYARSVESP